MLTIPTPPKRRIADGGPRSRTTELAELPETAGQHTSGDPAVRCSRCEAPVDNAYCGRCGRRSPAAPPVSLARRAAYTILGTAALLLTLFATLAVNPF